MGLSEGDHRRLQRFTDGVIFHAKRLFSLGLHLRVIPVEELGLMAGKRGRRGGAANILDAPIQRE